MLGFVVFAFILAGISGGIVYLYQTGCQLDLEIIKLDKMTAEKERELVKKKAEYAALNLKSIELDLKIADRLDQLDMLNTVNDGKPNRNEDELLNTHYFGDLDMLMSHSSPGLKVSLGEECSENVESCTG